MGDLWLPFMHLLGIILDKPESLEDYEMLA